MIGSDAVLVEIQKALKRKRLDLSDEKRLQSDIASAFTNHGIPFSREVAVGAGDIVDFMVGGIALEVKIRGGGSAMNIYRQVERYCKSDQVEVLVLMTAKTMTLPESINGKPVYVLSLGRTQL